MSGVQEDGAPPHLPPGRDRPQRVRVPPERLSDEADVVVLVVRQLERVEVERDQDGKLSGHVSFADPYCPELRPLAIEAARIAGMTVHEQGTVVVTQGPRFATRAESQHYSQQGWEVINMTQHPEAYLARELEMCY